MILKLLLFLAFFGLITKGQSDDDDTNQCHKKKTCGECIRFGAAHCVWCSAANVTGDRCQSQDIDIKWCGKGFLEDPQNILVSKAAEGFRVSENGTQAIQVTPQKLTYKLRPGLHQEFSFTYKPALNYPIDVYYLMDFSYSMKHIFDKLKEQGKRIYDVLIKGTNNVRLGFGSFVDKPALPIADTTVHNAYTFRNHLPLTKDYATFEHDINNIVRTSESNYDDPEAILEALMQVMVCDNVGWLNESRKVIFVSTDNTYHSAGDGKFVGAIQRNDMQCHIDNETLQLIQDYPSIGQIKEVASKKGFVIIFAVKSEVKNEYTLLEKHIDRSKYTSLGESDRIELIINDEYKSLVNHLNVRYDHTSNVELSMTPDCSIENTCTVENNGNITINGKVMVKSCDDARDGKEHVKISVLGLSEALNIEIEVICDCQCENLETPKSPDCSNFGYHKCGICYCDGDKSGEKCECDIESTDWRDQNGCKSEESESLNCNGRGKCICGKCYCDSDEFRGKYCQYNKRNCPRSADGAICSGRGSCELESCECLDGWSGVKCECSMRNDSCISTSSTTVCSGNGYCKCGKCNCYEDSGKSKFKGPFCDKCDECGLKRCLELTKQAICYYENETLCHDYNNTAHVVFMNKTEINKNKKLTLCNAATEDGGIVVFGYDYESPPNNTLLLVIQREKEVPEKTNAWIVIGATVGAILLIGLLTLIFWKILVDIYDAREYKKFEKSSLDDGYDVSVNPHYRDPAVSFQNPAWVPGSS